MIFSDLVADVAIVKFFFFTIMFPVFVLIPLISFVQSQIDERRTRGGPQAPGQGQAQLRTPPWYASSLPVGVSSLRVGKPSPKVRRSWHTAGGTSLAILSVAITSLAASWSFPAPDHPLGDKIITPSFGDWEQLAFLSSLALIVGVGFASIWPYWHRNSSSDATVRLSVAFSAVSVIFPCGFHLLFRAAT